MSELNTEASEQKISKRRPALANRTVPKPGMEKTIKQSLMRKLTENYYNRRRILTVPQEILDAHPDKHFVFLNMPRLEKNGMWNERGYELLKASDSPGPLVNKFHKSPDGYVHRNEMVLAYISKEEHEARQLEEKIARSGNKDLSNVLMSDDILARHFGVRCEQKTETREFPTEEVSHG